MPSAPAKNPLVWQTLASIVCLTLFFVFKPSGLAWWRTLLGVIFSVTLGHQLVRGILAMRRDSRQGWIEIAQTIAFVFLILAVLLLPTGAGWAMLVAGFLWPVVAKRVFT
jgi:hypothetical protein